MAAISSIRDERDGDQRHQEDDAEPERKGGAGDEVMALPERDDRREPGADDVGGDREHQGLARRSRRAMARIGSDSSRPSRTAKPARLM